MSESTVSKQEVHDSDSNPLSYFERPPDWIVRKGFSVFLIILVLLASLLKVVRVNTTLHGEMVIDSNSQNGAISYFAPDRWSRLDSIYFDKDELIKERRPVLGLNLAPNIAELFLKSNKLTGSLVESGSLKQNSSSYVFNLRDTIVSSLNDGVAILNPELLCSEFIPPDFQLFKVIHSDCLIKVSIDFDRVIPDYLISDLSVGIQMPDSSMQSWSLTVVDHQASKERSYWVLQCNDVHLMSELLFPLSNTEENKFPVSAIVRLSLLDLFLGYFN